MAHLPSHFICSLLLKDLSFNFICTSGMFGRVESSDVKIAQLSMQTAQKRQCRPKKTWDEILQDGRKKLGMDLATLKTGLNREAICF